MAPLAPLLGCWRGEFEGAADVHDERCFTPMLGGTYVRDVHSVRPTDYSGETIYAYDPIAAALTYSYFASDGGGIRSAVAQHGNTFVFAPADYVGADGARQRLRSTWRIDGPDRFVATTEREIDGAWQVFMRIAYRRTQQ